MARLRFSPGRAVLLRRGAVRLALLAGLAAASLGWPGCSDKSEAEKAPTVTVLVAAAEKKTIERKVFSDAVLFPLHEADLVPKISAPVVAYHVSRGSKVHAGELLAELENKDLLASLSENKGNYGQAQAAYETATRGTVPEQVQKAELDLKSAKETFDAQRKFYENRQALFRQGAIARKDLDDAAVTYTQAQNQYDMAKKHLEAVQAFGKAQDLKAAAGQLEAAKGRYEAAQAQLGYSEIRSPIEGVVTDRPLNRGQMASTGAPLITVMDLSQVVARAHISQQQAAGLQVGDAASLAAPGASDDIPGKVTVVSPALDAASTTLEVWVQAKNAGERLKPGTSVRITIVAETVPDAVVIPAPALLTAPDGSTSVIVAGEADKPEQRAVKVGIRSADEVQITDGLKPGERVVTAGAFAIANEDPEVLAKTRLQIAAPKSADEGGAKE